MIKVYSSGRRRAINSKASGVKGKGEMDLVSNLTQMEVTVRGNGTRINCYKMGNVSNKMVNR